MRGGILISPGTLGQQLKRGPAQVDSGLYALTEYYAPRVQSYARSNAKWTDQTGNARNGLRAEAGHESMSEHWIDLFHSVPYGIWLEVRWSGRYAIIVPTLRTMGAEVMASARNFVRGR